MDEWMKDDFEFGTQVDYCKPQPTNDKSSRNGSGQSHVTSSNLGAFSIFRTAEGYALQIWYADRAPKGRCQGQ